MSTAKKEPKEFEDRRLVIAVAIIASFLTIIAMGDKIPYWWGIMPFFLGLAALSSTIYIIATAANLKYYEPGRIYEVITVNEKFRRKMYDWAIHAFGAYAATTTGSLAIYLTSKDLYENMLKDNTWLLFLLILTVGASIFLFLRFLVWIISRISKATKERSRKKT
jgi:hypothetical protein